MRNKQRLTELGLVLIGTWAVGCQQPAAEPRVHDPQPEPVAKQVPAEPPPRPAPVAPAPAQPVAPQPAVVEQTPPPEPPPPEEAKIAQEPPPEKPAEEPAEDFPEWPRYVKLLELEKRGAKPTLLTTVDPPQRVSVETGNVKRFAITRVGLPLERRNRSIALKIDGQMFEWQGNHITVVFEHSPNGGWQVVERVAVEP